MTPEQYLIESARTEFTPLFIAGGDQHALRVSQLMHAAMGMVTESGEFIDALKKLTIYGKPIDKTNLVEEIGDCMWYVALACRALDVSLEDVMDRNIAKLRKRYPEKFTQEAALNRDLDAERKALEEIP
jgi:NTP pyrophosphatase (non-canonical NTP hydrolase)